MWSGVLRPDVQPISDCEPWDHLRRHARAAAVIRMRSCSSLTLDDHAQAHRGAVDEPANRSHAIDQRHEERAQKAHAGAGRPLHANDACRVPAGLRCHLERSYGEVTNV
jgi:hypothetical protein